MSRFILIIVLGAFITYSITSLTQNKNVTQTTENSVDNYSQTKARNIANSTIQMLMSQVADSSGWRVPNPVTKNIFDGQVTYTVTDTVFEGEDLIKFSVNANVFGTTKQVTAYTIKLSFIPESFKGAITANSNVLVNGSLTIDGRNHTMLGTVVPETGSYAIWTTGTFTQGGSSDLGGTHLAIDYVPSSPGDPNVIMENQIWTGSYPESPDEVLGGSANGFPEGMLKSIAQSGINGSQYVTDPASLTAPFSGVTYVEMPLSPGNSWGDSLDIDGSGIFVVHNNEINAVIKNLSFGTFKGIMIADDVVHIHATIIGTVSILTPNPSAGNAVGNSKGVVLYSKEVVLGALGDIGLETQINYGFGNNRLYVKHWFE